MLEQILDRIIWMSLIGVFGYITFYLFSRYTPALAGNRWTNYLVPRFPDPETCNRSISDATLTGVLHECLVKVTQYHWWSYWFSRKACVQLRKSYFKEDFWTFSNSFTYAELSICMIVVGLSVPGGNFDWWQSIGVVAIVWSLIYLMQIVVGKKCGKLFALGPFERTATFIGCRANAYFVLPIIMVVSPGNGLTFFALIVLVDETLGYLIQCFFVMPCAENRLLMLLKNPPTWGVVLFAVVYMLGINGQNVPIMKELAASAIYIVPFFIGSNLAWVHQTHERFYKSNASRAPERNKMTCAAKVGAWMRLLIGTSVAYVAYKMIGLYVFVNQELAMCHVVYVSGIASQLAFLVLDRFSPTPKKDVLIYLTSFMYQCKIMVFFVLPLIYAIDFFLLLSVL